MFQPTRSSPAFSPDTLLPELLQAHPQARAVFDRYGLRGCGGLLGPRETIRFFGRTHGVEERRLMRELTEAVTHPEEVEPSAEATRADMIYRRFFLAAIAVVLTAGATWGAYILWQIGLSGKFTGASLQAINARQLPDLRAFV